MVQFWKGTKIAQLLVEHGLEIWTMDINVRQIIN